MKDSTMRRNELESELHCAMAELVTLKALKRDEASCES